MALSKSLMKSQIPVTCQMCEESNEIKWKCLHCDFFLCTKCRRLHEKVKSTDQHTIIATYQLENKKILDSSKIPCKIHNGKNCCLFCQSCEEVVCPLCISKIHNGHKMIELDEGYDFITNAMKNLRIEDKLKQHLKILVEQGNVKDSEDKKYDSEKMKIMNRDTILKDEVLENTRKLLEELNERRKNIATSVNEEENRLKEINRDLEKREKDISKALNSKNAIQVFNLFSVEKILEQTSTDHVDTKIKKLPIFVPGEQVIQDFVFGSFVDVDQCETELYSRVNVHESS
ncbi:unnamed protein product [Mytilus edulis]|uniref:B box-type domain-containing protein n=1 Tax=Mytilus edulis TaxID=6550 RepID=A0A8S3V5K8_MYTED|nr:unnamed protein product [Mytilus edulis]